jgi:hypothetical protein
MSFQHQLNKSIKVDSEDEELKKWTRERPPSVNLLDLDHVFSIQPNTTTTTATIATNTHSDNHHHQLIPVDTDINTNKENESLLDKKDSNIIAKKNDKNKIHYNISLHKFDPLQSRTVENVDKKEIIEEKQSLKIIPTRLPTPRRPALSSHVSAEQFLNNNNMVDQTMTSTPTKTTQLDPTPPSSPGRRVRHTSIARLVKVPTKETLGKANRELAEFDPLISPVQEKRPSSNTDVTIKNQKDLLTSSIPKKGAQVKIKKVEGQSLNNSCFNSFFFLFLFSFSLFLFFFFSFFIGKIPVGREFNE